MQYFASYYWQHDAGNTASVLLQQAYHKKRRMPVLLACVSSETKLPRLGNILFGNMADWFYGTGLPLCSRNGERGMAAIGDSLSESVNRSLGACAGFAALSWAGILCVGQSFLLFRQGEIKLHLLNIRNQRPYCHELSLPESSMDVPNLQTGTIQRGAGILLATEAFHRGMPAKRMEECLNIQELKSSEQTGRRLQELGAWAEQQGNKDMGAVLLVTR